MSTTDEDKAIEQIRENTRILYAAPPVVAYMTTFENGGFVARQISAAELYK